MKKEEAPVTLVGAGLVGSLLSIFLAKKGLRVQVIEKRRDPRFAVNREGRSINLALSYRGLRALKEASSILYENVLAEAVPMYGRQMHDEQSNLSYQAYGANHECIHSVSRARLNTILIEEAEKLGVVFLFDHAIEYADVVNKQLRVNKSGETFLMDTPVLIAADGAFSMVRKSLEERGVCKTHMERIGHGYKELDISPAHGRVLENKNALHIWPRGAYMFIALPNFDDSYTGTLFLPFEGEGLSFETLKAPENIRTFFKEHFPDALTLLPDLEEQYTKNPASFLCNVYTDRWSFDTWLLIGDAAHGIVPFYGQGMNAGFEDCRILNELLSEHQGNWANAFQDLETSRKINTDAIARLAMDNFIEMRDLVGDEKFLLRKKIEHALSKAFPNEWRSLYSEVSFSDTPYHEALAIGKHNDEVMNAILNNKNIDLTRWEEKEEWEKISALVKNQQ